MFRFSVNLLSVGFLVFLLTIWTLPAAAQDASLFAADEEPERIAEIKSATELMRMTETFSSEVFEEILKNHNGIRFSGDMEAEEGLSKPVFDWINNNLFDKIDKPFVGYFPLIEDGGPLGFVVVKKELTDNPVIYFLAPDGDLKHLTRRL